MPDHARTELTPRWLDRVAVDRFCAGHDVGRPLTYAERLAAAAKLVRLGWTVNGAAEQARISPSTVAQLVGDAP